MSTNVEVSYTIDIHSNILNINWSFQKEQINIIFIKKNHRNIKIEKAHKQDQDDTLATNHFHIWYLGKQQQQTTSLATNNFHICNPTYVRSQQDSEDTYTNIDMKASFDAQVIFHSYLCAFSDLISFIYNYTCSLIKCLAQ